MNTESFVNRHNGPSDTDVQVMLNEIGVNSLEILINETVPADIRLECLPDLPPPISEYQLLGRMRELADANEQWKTFIGMGYYGTITPAVILRNVIENPGWYTQYTPYQAEISQGRLESLLNFQTLITDLTAMDIANASLLDEATAAAEAMHLMWAAQSGSKGQDTIFVDDSVFPQVAAVLATRCEPLGISVVRGNYATFDATDANVFGCYVQYPAANGAVRDYQEFCSRMHDAGALVSVGADLLSLCMLRPPGEFGADVVVGCAQRFGVPMGFGGPHAGFMATKEEFKRLMPGRIIGVSVDVHNNVALRMALQTREQHIRRDKATSNICTAQALLANTAAMYAVYHGPTGLNNIASNIYALTTRLAESLKAAGLNVVNDTWFDTLTVKCDVTMVKVMAMKHRINLWYHADGEHVQLSLDETTTPADVDTLAMVFGASANVVMPVGSIALPRTSQYLKHPVFNSYHCEHEMLRYIRRLENRDLSLTHSMIPLGSCTMKLNAAAEMIPLTLPGFSNIHPYVPLDQARGYMTIIGELNQWLANITGFDAVSLQPNAGAQGEYAGLLAIREFHLAQGNKGRNVALIPSSAHGTNPASAVMAGMKVVVVKADSDGHIDVNDLREKATQHNDALAALMVTYPSTHGVFEESIREVCSIVHMHGGLVYMDGANMNAQVGLTSPRIIGADICHLNLHKTFSIPHGGGGPGMGPICCTAELAPFLPGHPMIEQFDAGGEYADILALFGPAGAVSAAPWGSASVLVISYAYIAMMGANGLKRATEIAILNANYLKARLEGSYKILYKGRMDRVAHEMIVDLREFKQRGGIEAEDIAKRLMDYGYHAPTVSFPVAGTFMIEPTESESLAELDRFCQAMLAIREEIEEVCSGAADATDNVLKNAPHTQLAVCADEWLHGYGRMKAAFPLPWVAGRKFWPAVGRVNNSYGDRVLICTCPSVDAYAEAN